MSDVEPIWVLYTRIPAQLREPDYRPWDWRVAYDWWKKYRRMVTNDYPWQVGSKVLVTNFTAYGVSCGFITAVVVERIDAEDKMTLFRVKITGRKSRWYDCGDVIDARGYDITSR